MCEKAVSKSSRSAHVWNVHLVVKAFKCAGCSFRGVRKQEVKAHISELHGSVFVQILNEKQKYRQKYQEEWRKVMADGGWAKRRPNNSGGTLALLSRATTAEPHKNRLQRGVL